MEKTTFIERIKEELQEMGVENLEVINVERADKKYTGLTVKVPNTPSPVINMDALYAAYISGKSDMNECIGMAQEILAMKPDFAFDVRDITDWEKAKTRLYLRLFGANCSGIYREVEDLNLVPYLEISPESQVRVTPQLLDCWGIDEETLFDTARENQETLRPASIKSLEEMLGFDTGLPAYVISTGTGVCGAGVIFYEGIMDELHEELGEDYYILPCSIHEVIVIPQSMNDNVEEVASMVRAINGDCIEESERLSDSVYAYDGEFKKIA